MLAARAAPADCGAAVKADAYGCGIEAAVPALARAGCAHLLRRACLGGRRARAALDGAGLPGRIFVLNGFHPESAPFAAYRDHGLEAVIGSAEELAAWQRGPGRTGGDDAPGCALHVDTGMNRLGFPVEDARFLSRAELEAAGVRLVMSHLVSAEEPADPINARQIAAFDHARERALKGFPASLANSSGTFLPQRPFYDLVRPGYALYGGNPTPGRPNPMRPVVDPAGPRPAAAAGAGRRHGGLQRPLDGAAALAARHDRARLRRRRSDRRQRHRRARRRGLRGRRALPARRAASPWTCRSPT